MLHFDPTFYGDGNAMYSGVASWRRPGTHWAVDRESNGASEGDASFIAHGKLGAAVQERLLVATDHGGSDYS